MSEIENYLAPHHLDEALKAMADGDVTVLCGGTDLTLQTDSGLRKYASTLINIRRIDGLAEIDGSDGKIRIGALTTVSDIKENQMINELAPGPISLPAIRSVMPHLSAVISATPHPPAI